MTSFNKNPKISTSKKTILQVVPALISGGVERGTIEVSKKLLKVGYNIVVISAGGPLVEELKDMKITHITLNVASKNPFTIWHNTKLIIDVIKEYKVDLVHARSRAPAWSCYMSAKSLNKLFITTFHGIYSVSNPLKRYYNSIMTEGKRIIAVSNFVKSYILNNHKVEESKIRVIHRGVDENYFHMKNINPNKIEKFKDKYNIRGVTPVILLPARMSEWKGHIFLIEALSKIKNLEFQCLMVGELSKHPSFVRKVQEKIINCKLQSKVKIYGHELDILGLYAISDIVLSTSIQPEAFGRTIIEAQSMEKLVIATNIGGASETIKDQVTGFHIIPNDVSDLASKIQYSLSILGSLKFKTITKEARKYVSQQFSLEKMLNQTIDVYEEVL